MDLQELDDLFGDDDEDVLDFILNLRTYTIKQRIDIDSISDPEFYDRFRFRKATVLNIILPQVENILRYDLYR